MPLLLLVPNCGLVKLTEGKGTPFFKRTHDAFLFVMFARKRVDDIQKSDILFLTAPYASLPK